MSFATLVAQPLQQPFSVFQDDAGAYISPVGIDFTAPTEKAGVYLGDGSLLFENDSRTHFAFHYQNADVQYTHDFETNWVTLWSEGVTNHQCGVVVSNFISLVSWEHVTNRIVWKQTRLELKEPPQRTWFQPHEFLANLNVTNIIFSPWYQSIPVGSGGYVTPTVSIKTNFNGPITISGPQ